ncbi:MAG: hypothetical protein M0R03_23505 [Novosphingobium sp.]|jgi:hypothetical protein|nr:hypothetical protein [Novosphingobium sp.]MDD5355024.1 hypothetical protein [Candidatus Omnitrophota bacterium]
MEKIKEKLNKIKDLLIRNPHGYRKIMAQRVEEALALIEAHEKEDRFTVKVKIPETDVNGKCSQRCNLFFWLGGDFGCIKELTTKQGYPGPQCPRYKEEGK